jgi:hypothetical protein
MLSDIARIARGLHQKQKEGKKKSETAEERKGEREVRATQEAKDREMFRILTTRMYVMCCPC